MKMDDVKKSFEETIQAINRKPTGYDQRKGYGNYWDIEQGNEFYCIVGAIKDVLSEYVFQWKQMNTTQWRGVSKDKYGVCWINIVLRINANRHLRTYVEFNHAHPALENFVEIIDELGI